MDRYTEIDQPNAVYDWGMKKDINGEWVKYKDVKEALLTIPPLTETCPECLGEGKIRNNITTGLKAYTFHKDICPTCHGTGEANRPAQEWISVEVKLPHKDERRLQYLCYGGFEQFVTEYREYRDGWDFNPEYGRPTHWMPLPSPPVDYEVKR